MIKKIILYILIILLIIITYDYLTPPFEIKNSEAKRLSYKVRPFRDSVHIYIPYELTIYNNRHTLLKISRVFDENYRKHSPKNLLYNKDGIELRTLYGRSKKQYEGELSYFKIRYRKTIFPFTKRVFYYFKKHTLSNKNDVFGVKNINKDSIYKQLSDLKYNLKINKKNIIIDSLYRTNNLKIFNVDFKTERYAQEKYLKAKINSNQQIAIDIDYLDSTQNMNKIQEREYLYKKAKTNTKLDDF